MSPKTNSQVKAGVVLDSDVADDFDPDDLDADEED